VNSEYTRIVRVIVRTRPQRSPSKPNSRPPVAQPAMNSPVAQPAKVGNWPADDAGKRSRRAGVRARMNSR